MICIFFYFPTHLSFFLLNKSMSEIWFFLFLINFVNQIPIYSKIHESSYFLVNTILETTLKKRKNVLKSLYFPKVYSHAGLYTQIYSLFKSKMKIHVFLLWQNLIWVYITELSIIVIAKWINYLIWLSILSEWSLISIKALM